VSINVHVQFKVFDPFQDIVVSSVLGNNGEYTPTVDS